MPACACACARAPVCSRGGPTPLSFLLHGPVSAPSLRFHPVPLRLLSQTSHIARRDGDDVGGRGDVVGWLHTLSVWERLQPQACELSHSVSAIKHFLGLGWWDGPWWRKLTNLAQSRVLKVTGSLAVWGRVVGGGRCGGGVLDNIHACICLFFFLSQKYNIVLA